MRLCRKFFAAIIGVVLTWIVYFGLGKYLNGLGLTRLLDMHFLDTYGNPLGIITSVFVWDGRLNVVFFGMVMSFFLMSMLIIPEGYRARRILFATGIAFPSGLAASFIVSLFLQPLLIIIGGMHIMYTPYGYGQSGVLMGFMGSVTAFGIFNILKGRRELRGMDRPGAAALIFVFLYPAALVLLVLLYPASFLTEIAHSSAALIGFFSTIAFIRTEKHFVFSDPFKYEPHYSASLIVEEEVNNA